MKSLTAQFTDWVATKDASEEYDFTDSDNCAFARFGKEVGIPGTVGLYSNQLPPSILYKLVAEPYTFGALAQRLASR